MKKKIWTAAAVTVLAAVAVVLLWRSGFFQAASSLEGMRAYIGRTAPYAHLAFFAIQFLSVLLAPIPNNLTALAGAALFGTWPAFLLTAAAVVLGSMAVFCLARLFGASFAARFVSQKVAGRYLDTIRRKRDVFLFLVFLFPFFPDDLICILAGLTDIRPGRFFLLVLLTRPWGLLVSCLIGGQALRLPLWALALLAAGGVAFFAAGIKYGDRWERALLKKFRK